MLSLTPARVTTEASGMRIRIKYLHTFKDRHGTPRHYYRRGKNRVSLRGPIGSPEFWEDYLNAHGSRIDVQPSGIPQGSMRWLFIEYFKSGDFKQLKSRTQKVRRGILERFCENHGSKRYSTLKPKHLRRIRDTKAETPESANSLIKALRQVFRWAIEDEQMDSNPAADVAYLKPKRIGGWHTWELHEVEQYESTHLIGTTARLALALLLYTSQRKSDVVNMGRQHVRNGWMTLIQGKGDKRLEIPILAELQRIIDQSPTGELTFIIGEHGRPYTPESFGNRMRKWCDAAGLKHCSAHGLRKAGAVRMAHLGCTTHEIASITGHETLKEVERYTRQVKQRTLAEAAKLKLNGKPL